MLHMKYNIAVSQNFNYWIRRQQNDIKGGNHDFCLFSMLVSLNLFWKILLFISLIFNNFFANQLHSPNIFTF